MRLAYHPTGASLSAYALGVWLAAAKANIGAVAAPGVLVTLADPLYPFSFESAVLSDDRKTQAGVPYSRITGAVRRGTLDHARATNDEATAIRAWHAATLGGRIPFVVELPPSAEAVIVKTTVVHPLSRINWCLWKPTAWELTEYIP